MDRFSRWASWHVGLWAAVVAGLLTALGYWSYTPDDGFIHLTFTRNLASSGMFTFSSDTPVNGSTSPLWNIVNAIPVLLGVSPMIAAKILGYLSTVATVALASWLGFRASGAAAGWTVGCVICCDPWFLRWAVSGLETSLVLALVMASLALLYVGKPRVGCAVTGLLPLARPETLIYLILYGFAVIGPRPRRRNLPDLALLLLPGVVWAGYAYAQFGSVVQNSVRSKTLHYGATLMDRAMSFAKIAIAGHGLLLLVAGGLVVAGWSLRKAAMPRPLRLLLLGWPPLLLLGFAVSGSAVASRYYLPGTVVAYLAVAIWLAGQRPALRLGIPLVSCLASLGFGVFYVAPGIREYARNFNRAAIEISDSLNSLAGPGDIVAARDVGYLGYYNRSGYTILDLAGLVTPEMLEQDQRNAHVLRQQPKFVVEREKVKNAAAEGLSLEHFEVDAYVQAGALRFETTSYLGPPGLNGVAPEWYTLYSVDADRMDHVLNLAGAPD